jgi:hypothetical protein
MPMKPLLTRAACMAAVGLAVIACARLATSGAAPQAAGAALVNCNQTNQDAPVTAQLLASGVPCDVMATAPFDNLPHLQLGFDYYSWLTFLGLNAPAGGGVIGSGAQPGGDAPAAWEAWKEISDVMLENGARPAPWDAPRAIPAACQGLGGGKLLRMVGKTSNLLEDTDQPFDTGPLIDQNGSYVRYEILVNQPMFDYIVQNQLYSKAGQKGFASQVAFPAGSASGGMGALMVKAAWKVLGPNDNPARFHTSAALLYTPAKGQAAPSCARAAMGLVGLHVAHKTSSAPQWIWSTFEHRANVPAPGDAPGAHYNFNRPGCSVNCAPNQPPPRPWQPSMQPFPNGFTSQITRVTPITPEVIKLNASFQGLLTGTVWNNYQLVSTQWPTASTSPTDPNGVPAPVFLANTTMETYIQGRTPQASSSCIACHGNAAATSGRGADFTYILQRAR